MITKNKIRPISAKKRSDIIKHATRLFLKKGFGSISMDEIAGAARVSKRTLYNHLPNKKKLFCEITRMEWQRVKYPRISETYHRDPEVMFTAIMKHILKIMNSVRMKDLLRLVMAESNKFPELKTYQAQHGVDPPFQ